MIIFMTLTAIISKHKIQMNTIKRQKVQKIVIEQAGNERLILNDLILGRDGAQVVAQLIPEYHNHLMHLEIKGNNIDSQGLQMIFMALMNCPNLTTIQAQWNNLGSSPAGLSALLHVVRNLRCLELIDLKNNKISHKFAELIAQIIKINNRSLTVLDLRWNNLAEVGAQAIYPALAFNAGLKYIGLDDNQISGHTLAQLAQYLKNPTRGTLSLTNNNFNNQTDRNQFTGTIFPITDDAYPSMEAQMKSGQLRTKIQNQQQEAMIGQEKIQLEIQKVIQKIRVRGSQGHEAQTKFDLLSNENINLLNNLRQAQRVFGIMKQKYFGVDRNLSSDKSSLRAEKCHISEKMQIAMEKMVQRQQREIEDLNAVMSQKYDRLMIYYKERVSEKRVNREKVAELKQDIAKFKLSKESVWDKVSMSVTNSSKNSYEEECIALEEMIGRAEAATKAERKKGQYLTEELNNFVMRGLKKQEKFQQEIYEIQNKIKDFHKGMTLANVDIEQNQCKIALKESEIIEKQANVDMSRRYVKYIQSQTSVNLDIERLKSDQDSKAERFSEQTVQMRIVDVQRAVRQQQTQNRMIQNHYEKMLAQLQTITKSTIHSVLFEP